MRILICGIMPARAYSGGRYHAWLMAEAFAALSCDVAFWTTNSPIFLEDFAGFEHDCSVRLVLTEDFSEFPEGPWDYVWIIPHKHPPFRVFQSALEIAWRDGAKLCLLNFETPNWVAETSPQTVDPYAWRAWRTVAPHLDLILASTELGMNRAREYFGPEAAARYDYCNPPINDRAADAATPSAVKSGTRKSVVCITRFGGANGHKGGREILDYARSALSGCKLTFIVGAAEVPQQDLDGYALWAREHDVELAFQYRATDVEKFALLHSADMMIFLSRFEGFGYPPVEALYCGLPCIVYDLPVLREVSGDNLIYVPLDRPETLGETITAVLDNLERQRAALYDVDKTRFGFDAYVEKMRVLLEKDREIAPRLKSANEASVRKSIEELAAFDAEAGARTRKPSPRLSAKGRVAIGAINALAVLFAAVPPLRRLCAYALFHFRNFPALVGDKELSRLLFANPKLLSLRVRQNPAFLRHVMLSREGRGLMPEVQKLIEQEAAQPEGKRPQHLSKADDLAADGAKYEP